MPLKEPLSMLLLPKLTVQADTANLVFSSLPFYMVKHGRQKDIIIPTIIDIFSHLKHTKDPTQLGRITVEL